MGLIFRFLLVTAIFFSFAFSAAHAPDKEINKYDLTTEQWISDIDFLAGNLPDKHKNLFFQLSEEEFRNDISSLKENLDNMKDHEVIVEIMRILAKVGDSHTTVGLWRIKTFHYLPLGLYVFSDGIFVIQAEKIRSELVGDELIRIEDTDISKVIDELEKIIPHKNNALIELNVPWLLLNAEILNALGIADNFNEITLEFKKAGIVTLPSLELNNAKPEFVNGLQELDEIPMYLKNQKKKYWYTYLEEENTLYCQYNSCSQMDDLPFKKFSKKVLKVIDKEKIEKLIFDMRHNGGGNSMIAEPLIKQISNNETINKRGKLFVCIGRNTFSSTILNSISFKKATDALFIGEPTGGKPNHYGEVRNLTLPNSGLVISYSIKYFKVLEEDDPSFFPDIEINLSSADFFNGVDPVLEKILDWDGKE